MSNTVAVRVHQRVRVRLEPTVARVALATQTAVDVVHVVVPVGRPRIGLADLVLEVREATLQLAVGENPREALSELAKLGARLIIQRAVEDEFDAWLGRARYERRPDYQRGLRNYDSGLRNGFRPRRASSRGWSSSRGRLRSR